MRRSEAGRNAAFMRQTGRPKKFVLRPARFDTAAGARTSVRSKRRTWLRFACVTGLANHRTLLRTEVRAPRRSLGSHSHRDKRIPSSHFWLAMDEPLQLPIDGVLDLHTF